jgi:integrase
MIVRAAFHKRCMSFPMLAGHISGSELKIRSLIAGALPPSVGDNFRNYVAEAYCYSTRHRKSVGVTVDDLLLTFRIHDLRNTHATHLLQEGWPVIAVSRRLGHANPAITLAIYAHALTDIHGDNMQTPIAFRFGTWAPHGERARAL